MKYLGLFAVTLIIACAPKKPTWDKEKLRAEIIQIADSAKAEHVGVVVMDLESGDSLSIKGNEPFPMQSVFKLPLSMVALHEVDKGKRTLADKIHITKEDMAPYSWSPIKDKYPNAEVDLPLSDLIGYMVSQSDNVSCDKMFAVLGGPRYVDSCIHAMEVKGISIVATEAEMGKDWNVQYSNWCQPGEMANMLVMLYNGKLLSPNSTAFLLNALKETSTGGNRIKGLLPAGTVVMHKTGTGANDKDYYSVVNDMGIVTLPNGKHLVVAIFISNSTQSYALLERTSAKIAKAAWDDAIVRQKIKAKY